MTRSTRHRTPLPQLAALVFAALRLGLENRQEMRRQTNAELFVSEAERCENGGAARVDAINIHPSLSSASDRGGSNATA